MKASRLLVAILLGLTLLKALFNPFPHGDIRTDDGADYFQVARHVATGDGLVTSVSRFHNGLTSLPHTVTFYPLWPFVLGTVGRWMDLTLAAQLLPECLYLVALGLIYAVARRIAAAFGPQAELVIRHPIELNAGHVAVLLLGLNHVFFRFTSLPFTEGMAMSLTLGALLATFAAAESGAAVSRSLLAGLLAGLAYLARAQCIGLAVALPVAMALGGGARPKRVARAAALAAGAWMPIIAWAVYVFSSVNRPNVRMLVDNTALVEIPELGPYVLLVQTGSLVAYVIDRSEGLLVAFNPFSLFSYVRSFGAVTYLVPIAIGVAAVDVWRKRERLRPVIDDCVLPAVVTALAGAAMLGPVHLKHAARFADWSFQFRDGLPLIFLIVVAVPFLLTRSRQFRALTLLCLVESLAEPAFRLRAVFKERIPAATKAHKELAAWIKEQSHLPTFLSTRPTTLAASSGGLHYAAVCRDPESLLKVYRERLGVEYVLTQGGDESCGLLDGLRRSTKPIRTFGDLSIDRITLWSLH